jgi:FlaA1/EpsC-like NDP-sugar epimerase
MTRYLIDAYEAAGKLWDQFMAGKRLIVPDCGDPVPLLEIAERALKKHGIDGFKDYAPGYVLIGNRGSEKLSEKLYWDNEQHD